jgi:hypothetical protein
MDLSAHDHVILARIAGLRAGKVKKDRAFCRRIGRDWVAFCADKPRGDPRIKTGARQYVQVLGVAREMGVLKLGTVALGGTKIHANASRHSALSYEHASKIEAQLKAEVADLLGKAEAADQADVPDGMQVPEELGRREKRLAEIARAKVVIEARAKERHARERAEYEAKMAERKAKQAQTGKRPSGRVPQPPVEGPLPTDQVNLTDEESRIMPVAGGGFEQCYNAQAAVAADSLLVVATDVVQAPNDKQQLEPMLDKIAELPAELGKVDELLADNGYYSESNVNACAGAGIEPVIAMGREAHHPSLAERFAEIGAAERPHAGRSDASSPPDKGGKKSDTPYASRRPNRCSGSSSRCLGSASSCCAASTRCAANGAS